MYTTDIWEIEEFRSSWRICILLQKNSILNCIFQLTSFMGHLLQSPCILLLPSFFSWHDSSAHALVHGWGTCLCCVSMLLRSLYWFWVLGRSSTVRWNRSIHGKFCLLENSVQSFEKGEISLLLPVLYPISSSVCLISHRTQYGYQFH